MLTRILFTVLALAITTPVYADKYVRQGASGTDSGADWTNACPAFSGSCAPSAWTRGETIWVADSSTHYGNVVFNTAASGSTLITVRKATEAAHGTETGWDTTYGDGVATFTHWAVRMSHVVFDGQDGGGPGSWTTGFGFKVLAADGVGVGIGHSTALNLTNITLRHFEVEGGGDDGAPTPDNDLIWIEGTANAITLSYLYLHNAGRVLLFHRGNNVLVEYAYTGSFESVSAEHAEIAALGNPESTPASNWTFRWSVFTHGEGTGGIIFNGSNLTIYGSVFVDLGPGVWQGNGAIGGWSWGDWVNVKFYNNSFIDVGIPINPGNDPAEGCSSNCSDISSGEYRNNLFYSSSNPISGNLTHTHNHYVDQSVEGGGSNETSGTGDPFEDFVNLDFRLTGATTAGTTLASPYNVDMCGNTRGADGTWDRGAIEFFTGMADCTSSGNPPEPPANAAPVVTITTPTSDATGETLIDPLASLAGTATDSDGTIATCSGLSDRTGAFAVTDSGTPTATDVDLESGANVLTISCTDDDGAVGSDVLTYTLNVAPSAPEDDFTRADSASLGANWTVQTTTSPSIVSNQIASSSSGAKHAYWNAHVADADQFSQITVQTVATNTRYVYALCRATHSGASLYDHYQLNTDGASGSGHTQLNKVVDGSLTVLTSYATTFTTGDVLRIECTGTTTTSIKAYKNGVQIGSTYDDTSSPLTSGQYGTGVFGTGAAGDNWQGGDIDGGAPADETNPSVTITSPTSNATMGTGSSTLSLAGVCSDDTEVDAVTWACPTCTPTSGTATGTTAWSEASIGLATGANAITVTCADTSANDATDVLTATYTPVTGAKRRIRLR